MHVTVIGAGPAGTSAALAALGRGASVSLYDRSKFPRHKVCGEFLSPYAAELLDSLGVWGPIARENPSVLRGVSLYLGESRKQWKLSEPARGVSRYRMDKLLLDAAIAGGAEFHREPVLPKAGAVLAYGRMLKAAPGERLFGFKAHFHGPADDSMRLYFFDGGYVGVNCVEGNITNVCGLAPESILSRSGFVIDEFLRRNRPLSERLAPLKRTINWLTTGPLVFGLGHGVEGAYSAGDCAAFIDPFTGSGMLGAIATGILAGRAAASKSEVAGHRERCRAILQGQQRTSSILREAIASGWAERLLPAVPGRLLFNLTRPRKVYV